VNNWHTWWCSKAGTCKVIVPLLSPSFFESKACTDELTFAANNGCTIIPVLAEPFGMLPSDCQVILQTLDRVPLQGNFADYFDDNLEILFQHIIHADYEQWEEGYTQSRVTISHILSRT